MMADGGLLLDRPAEPDLPLSALDEALASPFSDADRRGAAQAAVLLEQAWVNWSGAARGPVEQLRRLADGPPVRRGEAFRTLLAVFAALGDRHTDACLPAPFAEAVAFLPFLARPFWRDGERGLVVTGSEADGVERGDLILAWNGRPIEEALRRHEALQLAANAGARAAKAVQTLTFRPMAWLPPPDDEEVALTVRRPDGAEHTTRLRWRLSTREALTARFGAWAAAAGDGPSLGVVETCRGGFGLVRFGRLHARPDDLTRRFAELLEEVPTTGLVIDLRGCEQGVIAAAESLLQLVGAGPVEPEPFELRVTPLILSMVEASPALAPWRDAARTAARRGEPFSAGVPITSPQAANATGRRYSGPVIVLVDALTYSSAEMLAAGIQDHGMGLVVGTEDATGGGGGSPWPQAVLAGLSGRQDLAPGKDQPSLRVSARRCRRVGRNRGRLIEGIGVAPDHVRRPTLRDVLDDDQDLHDALDSLLAHLGSR